MCWISPYLKLPTVEVELHSDGLMVIGKGVRWYIWIEKMMLVIGSFTEVQWQGSTSPSVLV